MKSEEGDNYLGNISVEYLGKVESIINFSKGLTKVVSDKLFNIKLSLSLLKGGIIDYQKGKIDFSIKKEIKEIKENLAWLLRTANMTRRKLENIRNIKRDSALFKEISKEHYNKITEFISIIWKFETIFKEKILNTLYESFDEIDSTDLKEMSVEDINIWHSKSFSLINYGLNMVKSNRNNTKQMEDHLRNYKQNVKNESKIQVILKEIQTGKMLDSKKDSIDINYLKPGTIVSKNMYSEDGQKLKTAYETITEEDLYVFKSMNIKRVNFKLPEIKELNPSDYKIEIIDDSKTTTTMVQSWLNSLNFNVVSYNDPIKALYSLKKDFPDLILLDITMPDMDGFEFLEKLNSENSTTKVNLLPVIMLTSQKGESAVRKALELGAVDYHAKPIDKELLLNKILSTLELENK